MVRAKKRLGQHFLKDQDIARRIVEALTRDGSEVLEIGPGTGVLTDFLIKEDPGKLYTIEIDSESVAYLQNKYPQLGPRILQQDFLQADLSFLPGKFKIIGNFPYNISSQIFFKVIQLRDRVNEVVCMLQEEVARRLASPPGNKDYGILSVLLQAYYRIDYLFTVDPSVFHPPPKVKSGVIRLERNAVPKLDCDENLFKTVVKQGFQNRRKTLRNALKPLNLPTEITSLGLLDQRAETLTVQDFVGLTKQIEEWSR